MYGRKIIVPFCDLWLIDVRARLKTKQLKIEMCNNYLILKSCLLFTHTHTLQYEHLHDTMCFLASADTSVWESSFIQLIYRQSLNVQSPVALSLLYDLFHTAANIIPDKPCGGSSDLTDLTAPNGRSAVDIRNNQCTLAWNKVCWPKGICLFPVQHSGTHYHVYWWSVA